MTDRLIELARRCRKGSRADLEELLQGCIGIVHALARARLGDSEAAETATAQALQNIATGVSRLRDPQAFPAWVQTITSRCIAQLAQTHRTPGWPREPEAPGGQPLDALLATEERQRVRAGLHRLPPEQREPLLLHFVEGMTYREIAAFLSISLGSVVRRMQRSLGTLQAELADERSRSTESEPSNRGDTP